MRFRVTSIYSSFSFAAGGTRQFTHVYRYCGPPENSHYNRRTWYKLPIFNRYRSEVLRIYFWWNGDIHRVEYDTAKAEVPYMGIWLGDS